MAQAPLTPESLRTVYRAIGRGDLVARKLGKRTIVLASDLQRFLETLPRMGRAA